MSDNRNKIKKLISVFILMLCTGCVVSSVSELKEKGNYFVYYTNDSLQNVYNRAIKKYNECGITVHNTFIDNNAGEAGISYMLTTARIGWLAYVDMKRELKDKIKVIVYHINTRGLNGRFVEATQYAVENKIGCP